MKKTMLTLFLLSLFPSIISAASRGDQLNEDCKKMLSETKTQYIELIANDILATFQMQDILTEENSIYFTPSELWKSEYLVGKNNSIHHFKEWMSEKYRGEMRLYFMINHPQKGYILFKDSYDNNVMLTIEKSTTQSQWKLIKEERREGKHIDIATTRCKEEHFMQKMFDNLYP